MIRKSDREGLDLHPSHSPRSYAANVEEKPMFVSRREMRERERVLNEEREQARMQREKQLERERRLGSLRHRRPLRCSSAHATFTGAAQFAAAPKS